MGNPEGGHGGGGERRDNKAHFSKEIEKLLIEASDQGESYLASVLATVAAALDSGNIEELSKLCSVFAEQKMEELTAAIAKGKGALN